MFRVLRSVLREEIKNPNSRFFHIPKDIPIYCIEIYLYNMVGKIDVREQQIILQVIKCPRTIEGFTENISYFLQNIDIDRDGTVVLLSSMLVDDSKRCFIISKFINNTVISYTLDEKISMMRINQKNEYAFLSDDHAVIFIRDCNLNLLRKVLLVRLVHRFCFDMYGNIYGTVFGSDAIDKYDSLGNYIGIFSNSLIKRPVDIILDPSNGTILVFDSSQNNMNRFNIQGQLLYSKSLNIRPLCTTACVDTIGNIVLVDHYIPGISIFNSSGLLVNIPPDCAHSSVDVAIDSSGKIYTIDPNSNCILIYGN